MVSVGLMAGTDDSQGGREDDKGRAEPSGGAADPRAAGGAQGGGAARRGDPAAQAGGAGQAPECEGAGTGSPLATQAAEEQQPEVAKVQTKRPERNVPSTSLGTGAQKGRDLGPMATVAPARRASRAFPSAGGQGGVDLGEAAGANDGGLRGAGGIAALTTRQQAPANRFPHREGGSLAFPRLPRNMRMAGLFTGGRNLAVHERNPRPTYPRIGLPFERQTHSVDATTNGAD